MFKSLCGLSLVVLFVVGNSAPTKEHQSINYNFTTVQKVGKWEVIKPGGDTGCSKGGEYAFFYKQGTNGKLVINFEGGGACWDFATCLLPSYKRDVQPDRIEDPSYNYNLVRGIYDESDDRNPLKDWSMLVVSYCTADAHCGDNSRSVLGMNFNGKKNTQAALEFITKRVDTPTAVLTTGQSAGALAGMVWVPHVIELFPRSQHFHFADSYLGVVSTNHLAQVIDNWNIGPSFLPKTKINREQLLEWGGDAPMYTWETNAMLYPNVFFTHLTSEKDLVQDSFFVLGGGGLGKFTPELRRHLQQYRDGNSNIGYYVIGGNDHVFMVLEKFFSKTNPNTISMLEYFNGVLKGTIEGSANQFVDCDGDCGSDESRVSNITDILTGGKVAL